DGQGRFAMQGIVPGKYEFNAQHAGFIDASYGARRPGRQGLTLSLEAGQRVTAVVFRMTAQAVITGRIVDSDGDPVQGVSIPPLQYRYTRGKRELSPLRFATTDDLGEYRLFGLAPGRYFLQASHREIAMGM